jgi:hypothetical protein
VRFDSSICSVQSSHSRLFVLQWRLKHTSTTAAPYHSYQHLC